MIQGLFGLIGGIVLATGGYLAAKLKNSGKINTTEAETLWNQLQTMFHDVTERANELELQLGRQKQKHDESMDRMFKRLEATELRCAQSLDDASKEIQALREQLSERKQ